MPVKVTTEEPVDEAPAEATPTKLGDLRAKLAAVKNAQVLNLEVPEWASKGGISVWVRYGPVNAGHMARSVDKREKSKDPDWEVLANADVLVNSCIGVYALVGNGDEEPVEVSLSKLGEDAPLTRFDRDLGEALGLTGDNVRAVDVCRALYPGDLDIKYACSRLVAWSTDPEKRTEGFPTP